MAVVSQEGSMAVVSQEGSMAVVSQEGSMAIVVPRVEGVSSLMKDSMVLSLLDRSWFEQPILTALNPDYSMAVCVPSLVSETDLRSSEPNGASGFVSLSALSMHHMHEKKHCEKSANGELIRGYSVEEAELRRVFDRFDENADGVICGKELRRCMRCCYGSDLSDAEVKSIISCVDRNEDGAVDFEEFLSLYQKSHSGQSMHAAGEDEDDEHDLVEAFRVFDTNQDGFISAHELQAVLLNLGMPEGRSLTGCEKMIQKVDRNGDGQCDIREFQEMMSAPFSS